MTYLLIWIVGSVVSMIVSALVSRFGGMSPNQTHSEQIVLICLGWPVALPVLAIYWGPIAVAVLWRRLATVKT